jgi:geranylgeranyl pyrophosphate synthase
MIQKKTAALVEMCCSVGAQIGKGSIREIKALEKYGKNLGMAFQIQDDLLDIIADEKKLGKVIGSDLIEGKKTYLFLRALEKAKSEDKKELIKVIEKRGIRKNQVKKYRDIYVRLGVIDDALNEVKRYTGYALEELDNLYNPEAKLLLLELANALIKRSK